MKRKTTIVIITALCFTACKKANNSITTDIKSGMIVHYEFSNNLADNSGNSFNGIGDTAIDFVPDRFSRMNEAIRFNGGTHQSYFIMPALGSKQVDSVYSVSFWFTITTAGSSAMLYKADMNEGAESAHTLLLENGKLRVIVGDGNNKTKEFDGLNTIASNTWQHLVLTVNGSQRINIYLNGNEVYNSMLSSFHDDFSRVGFKSNAAVAVGLLGGRSPYPLTNGKIDDFRLYNKALSYTEILSLYNYKP